MERLAGSLIQKVPLFHGFRPREMKAFLEVCKLGAVAAGEVLCEYNTSSNRLFILVEGRLDIVGPDNTSIAVLQGVQTVGEMGFITRKPRTATVRAGSECRVLRVDYFEFENLIERNLNLRSKIYRNMVRILADRLSDANDKLMRYRKRYESDRDPASFAREEDAPDLADDARAELAEVAVVETDPEEDNDDSVSEERGGDGVEVQVAEAGDQDAELLAEADVLLKHFYELAGLNHSLGKVQEDLPLYRQLRQDGYTSADIEYAVKWTVRNIPNVKRFSLVKLSIKEAFEDKWSV